MRERLVIVPRAWTYGAAPPKWTKFVNHPAKYVILGTTRGDACYNIDACRKEFAVLQHTHLECSYIDTSDIRYNFLIGGDGRAYEARGWYNRPTVPTRLGKLARDAIYISYFGTFKDKPVPPYMRKIANALVIFGVRYKYISPKPLEYTIPPWVLLLYITLLTYPSKILRTMLNTTAHDVRV